MSYNKKIKVLFFLPNLKAGGAERVMSFVAQNINKEKFDVILYIIGYEKDKAFETTEVRTIYFNKNRVLAAIPLIIGTIRREKPKVVVTAIGHLNIIMSIISLLFPKVKFIGREVNVISVLKNFSDSKKRNEFPLLSILAYKILDHVICQSRDMANDLMANYKVSEKKIVVINNPITGQFKVKQKIGGNREVFQLVTVGRLAKQKGHLRILEILKELSIPFHYTIIGDGPERDTILQFVDKNGLTNVVTHIPFTKEVSRFLAKSDVFLQGSYVEGFPNALIESCAVGTPVIAFQAKGGIDEIVENGINGFMAHSHKDFKAKLESVLHDIDNWNPVKIAATVNKKYSAANIIGQYENLLTTV